MHQSNNYINRYVYLILIPALETFFLLLSCLVQPLCDGPFLKSYICLLSHRSLLFLFRNRKEVDPKGKEYGEELGREKRGEIIIIIFSMKK